MGLAETIRAKVALGIIQRAYATQPMLYWGGVAARDLCRVCDESLAGDIAVGYRSQSGDLHWFHLGCDEIRKDV